jgi:hypothetical protein
MSATRQNLIACAIALAIGALIYLSAGRRDR